jgi:hypothetical protein
VNIYANNKVVSDADPLPIRSAGNTLAEQKTQADAVSGTITFSKPVARLEIYNLDETNAGVFNVNGINVTVPAGRVFSAQFGGTPRTTVQCSGSTSYILTTYE